MILTLLVLSWIMDPTGLPPAEGEPAEPPVLAFIQELTGLERPWARPIETVDLDQLEEQVRSGWLTFHTASWWVEKDDDER